MASGFAATIVAGVLLASASPATASTPDDLLRTNDLTTTTTGPDGSVLALGVTARDFDFSGSFSSPDRFIALFKLNASGQVDPQFGDGGVVLRSVQSGDVPVDLLDLGDGSVIIVSTSGLHKFGSEGAPDFDFGSAGTIGLNSEIFGADVQADGKLVVVSTAHDKLSVHRFDASGAPDPSFGTAGTVIHPYFPFPAARSGVVVDGQGRIVIAAATIDHAIAFRLLPDGSPDPAFGPGGDGIASGVSFGPGTPIAFGDVTAGADGRIRIYTRLHVDPYEFPGFRSVIDDDGNPVAGGSGLIPGGRSGHSYAELPDGDLAYAPAPSRGDVARFGVGWLSRPDWTDRKSFLLAPDSALANSLSYENGGSLLAGGFATGPVCTESCVEQMSFALVRLDASTGEPDPGFGVGGRVRIPENRCAHGVGAPLSPVSPGPWARCRVKPPGLRANLHFRKAWTRRPALKGTVSLLDPPDFPVLMRQKISVRLPGRLRMRAARLRSRIYVRPGTTPEVDRLEVKGRRITFEIMPENDDYSPIESAPPDPPNEELIVSFGVRRGVLKPIARRLRHARLHFRVKGTYFPLDFRPGYDPRSPWFADKSSYHTVRIRPVPRRR